MCEKTGNISITTTNAQIIVDSHGIFVVSIFICFLSSITTPVLALSCFVEGRIKWKSGISAHPVDRGV